MLNRTIEILLIEDNEADVDLTKEALAHHKTLVNLNVARTGEEGLQFLSRTGLFAGVIRPDLILLDLNLPGMDGREVLKEIKSNLEFHQIPVVILTTSEADLDVLKSYSIGANCYIVKPIDFENFSHVVKQIEDFWFTVVKLPKHELAESCNVESSTSTILPFKEKSDGPIQVLQVEDSDADADLIFESLSCLSDPQFTLHRAVRLVDAFEYLEAHAVDVALLDLSLPDSHGFETVVRFLEKAPNLPVVVLTGTDNKALGIRAVKEGAQDYLVKGQVEGEFLGRIILYAIERKSRILRERLLLESAHLARDEAEKAVGIRDEFLSIASHELRTPLTALSLQIQLLVRAITQGKKDDLITGRFRKMAEIAELQIHRFAHLIETLLNFSSIQSGRLKLEYSIFDLNELVRESIERLIPELKNAGCEIKMNLGQPVIGEWDRLRLEQVLINLLSNGMKYARGKPLEVSVSSQGQGQGQGDGESVWILVTDHGRGIAPQDKEKIFQRFERVGDTKSVSGLGLGLYVVREIIDTHSGTVNVKSELGVGSTFEVHLPMKATGTLPGLVRDTTSLKTPIREKRSNHG